MKQRIISASIILLITIPLILLGGMFFRIFVTIIGILGLREIIKLDKKDAPIFVELVGLIFMGILINYKQYSQIMTIDKLLLIILLIFIFLAILYKDKFKLNELSLVLLIMLIISMASWVFIDVRNERLALFLYLVLVSTITDTFALFTGKLIGKHKMTKISPNKTWEGAIGGLLAAIIVGTSFYYIVINSSVSLSNLVGITLFLSMVGQLGDLFFSSIKRSFKIKNFSELIPGHGGILDRLDSLLFVALGYQLLVNYL